MKLLLFFVLVPQCAAGAYLLDSILGLISVSISPAVHSTLSTTFFIKNGAIDPNERPAKQGRAGLFAETQTLEAIGAVNFVFWIGVQNIKDSYSYWNYPTNMSWVGGPPKYHNGRRTKGHSWEEGFDTLMNNSWLGLSGEILLPLHTTYAWDWTAGPGGDFLRSSLLTGNEAGWNPKCSAWAGEPQIVFGSSLYENTSDPTERTHLSMLGLRVAALEARLADLTALGDVAFVVDTDGDLVFSSVPGVTYSCPGWESCIQTKGVECADSTIAATTSELLARGAMSVDSEFVLEGRLVSTKALTKMGGSLLGTPWLVVTVSPVSCNRGYYFTVQSGCLECAKPLYSKGGASLACDTCLPGYYKGDYAEETCKECPKGVSCNGNSKLASLNLKKGFWRFSPQSTKVLECPMKGGCSGGANQTTVASGGDDVDDNSSGYCSEGYTGVLCSSCDEEYFFSKDSNACTECGVVSFETVVHRVLSSTSLLVFFVAAVAALLSLVWMVGPTAANTSSSSGSESECFASFLGWADRTRRQTKMKLKCLMSFAQIASETSFNTGIQFPKVFEASMNILSVINFDIVPSLGLSCWFESFDYIGSMLLTTLIPIFLCLAIGAFRLVHKYRNHTKKLKSSSSSSEEQRQSKLSNAKELAKVYAAPKAMRAVFTQQEIEDLRKTFAFSDTDRSGAIDKDELFQVLTSIDAGSSNSNSNSNTEASKRSREEVDQMFKDVKGEKRKAQSLSVRGDFSNNEICFGEFLEAMHAARSENRATAFSALQDKVDAKNSQSNAHSYVYAVLVVSFLVLQGATSSLCQYFRCRDFKKDDGADSTSRSTASYMIKDYSISCDSERYKTFIVYAIFMILVYPIGIPLSWFVMLRHKRAVLLSPKLMAKEEEFGMPKTGHLSFLVESYKPKYYYFEVVECVRRIMSTSAVGLIDNNSAYGPVCGILICFAFLHVFTECKPYKVNENNALAGLLMYTLTLIFLAALLVKLNAIGNAPGEQTAFAVVLMIVVYGSLFLGLVISSFRGVKKPITEAKKRNPRLLFSQSSGAVNDEEDTDEEEEQARSVSATSFRWEKSSSPMTFLAEGEEEVVEEGALASTKGFEVGIELVSSQGVSELPDKPPDDKEYMMQDEEEGSAEEHQMVLVGGEYKEEEEERSSSTSSAVFLRFFGVGSMHLDDHLGVFSGSGDDDEDDDSDDISRSSLAGAGTHKVGTPFETFFESTASSSGVNLKT